MSGRALRVLHVVHNLSPGGAQRLVIDISRRIHPQIPTRVCCLDQAGDWAHELQSVGIDVIALGRQPGFRPLVGWQIARIAAEWNATVLHCHQYSPFVYGSLASLRTSGLRLVFTEHGRNSDEPATAKRIFATRLLASRPHAIVAVSDDLRRFMTTAGFPEDRIEVLHNGIDPLTEPGAEDRLRARRDLAIPDHAFVVGTVARLDPVKNLGTLLEAFATFHAQVAEARLVVIGDGPERTRLEWMISEHGLAPAVHLAGHRSDARALLPSFDVYVNSSVTEGISLTLLEAMAARLPTVATRVGGTPEVVVDGMTGVLVPAREPAAMAAALADLHDRPDARRAFGEAGRARIVDQFSIDRMMQAYLAAYTGLRRGD